MIEEEQIVYVMQMFLQGVEFGQVELVDIDVSLVMDIFELVKEEDDYDVMQDFEFFQSVLENFLGVDFNNEVI